MDETYLIALSPERATVGCALIQAALGGTVPSHLLGRFDWDLNIEGMRLYPITEAMLERYAKGGEGA